MTAWECLIRCIVAAMCAGTVCYVPGVFAEVLTGALDAGAPAGVLLASEVLGEATLLVESPLLAELLVLAVAAAAGVLGDEDPVRLSVL